MSRVLIASWDGGGNTPPAYRLGARLRRRGHRVRLLGWAPMRTRATAAGLEFTTYPTVPAWPAGVAHEDEWNLWCECLFGAACGADIAAEVASFRPDVVVLDCMLRAGLEADLGVPTVALVHVSYQQFVHVWGDQVLGTDVGAMLGRCAAALAVQPPGFDEPCELPRGHEYVGVIGDPEPARDERLGATLTEPGDPWVLVSLSTTDQAGQRAALQGILDGLASAPLRVLATLGGTVSAAELDVPTNARVHGFVPHEQVLPRAAAVVTHAGMSTVTAALAAGVPMVCVPQGRDQGGNAERVAALGAGVVADVAGVRAAVEAVLADASYRRVAGELAAAAAPLGNGARAVEVVERLVRAPRSVAVLA